MDTPFLILVLILTSLFFLLKKYNQNRKKAEKPIITNFCKPKLNRIEFVEMLVIKGYKKRDIKVVYNTIKENSQLNNILTHPNDNIHFIFNKNLTYSILIKRICKKLKIQFKHKELSNDKKQLKRITFESILNLIQNFESEFKKQPVNLKKQF